MQTFPLNFFIKLRPLHEEQKSRVTGRNAKIKNAKPLILGETQKSLFCVSTLCRAKDGSCKALKFIAVTILGMTSTLLAAAPTATEPNHHQPHSTHTPLDKSKPSTPSEEEKITQVENLRTLALSGNPDAQFSLASAYDSGYGLHQDYTKAAYWYGKAAQHGHVDALFSLAVLTEEGLGVKADHTKALQAYRQGAIAGHAPSQNNLGIALATWANNPAQAKHWFTQAAQQGHAEAQYNLALILLTQNSINATQEARQWLNKAANTYPPAQQLLKTFQPTSSTTPP